MLLKGIWDPHPAVTCPVYLPAAPVVVPPDVALRHIRAAFHRRLVKLFDVRLVEPVVRIDEGYVLPLGKLEPQIARGRDPAVFLSYISDAVVPLLPFPAALRRIVGGTVVYQQYLDVPECLVCKALHALLQVAAYVVDGKYHRYRGALIASHVLSFLLQPASPGRTSLSPEILSLSPSVLHLFAPRELCGSSR